MMRGEFIAVWSETWRGVWSKLAKHPAAPGDLFAELYRELTEAFIQRLDSQTLANIVDDKLEARIAFRSTRASAFRSERALVVFLEESHNILFDLGGDALANRYFNLMTRFIDRYSLRYDLRRSFSLCTTLPGVFTGLVLDLREMTKQDIHLDRLMKDFEDAIRDLHYDESDARIKTCIQKQVNLLEALGRSCTGVTQTTLGRICDQLQVWPHTKVRDAMKDLYGFTSDYPGIRHGGTPGNALRDIDTRDLIAMSVLLAGFSPYLTDRLNPERILRGV